MHIAGVFMDSMRVDKTNKRLALASRSRGLTFDDFHVQKRALRFKLVGEFNSM
jgi:hypothetical protein